jgi:iron complex outermembrane receptor protein
MFRSRLFRCHALLACAAWSMLPAAAQAQKIEEASTGLPSLNDIVVTAQKRSENLQDVPISITALTGDVLGNRQITELQSLSQSVPNVHFGQNLGQARIAIRGLGLTSENQGNEARVAFHTDGIYISRPGAVLGSFFDVERVEILRGPQGTLYGRNAVAGSVNLITRGPTKNFEGFAEATVGNYSLITIEAGLGGPLSDAVSFRVAGYASDRAGYGINEITGEDVDDLHSRAVRGKLRFEPSSSFDVTLSADYALQDDHSSAFHYGGQVVPGTIASGVTYGGNFPANPRNITSDSPVGFRSEVYGVSATANLALGNEVELTSVSAYRNSNVQLLLDIDETQIKLLPYSTMEDSFQLSEELRLAGQFARGKWIVGGYLFKEDISTLALAPLDRILLIPNLPSLFVNGFAAKGSLKTVSYAVFGQLDYNLVDGVTLTVGGRYNRDRRTVDELQQFDLSRPYNPQDSYIPVMAQSDEVSYGSFTPKFGLQYRPNDDFQIFASYSKGFKSGNYNLGAVSAPFRPEKLSAYEIGFKSDFANRAVRLNVSAFYYDFKDLQVARITTQNVILENAASAEVYGVEAELTAAPTKNLKFDFNAAYTHSEYRGYSTEDSARPNLGLLDLTGNPLQQAPKYSGTAGIEYSVPTASGKITFRGEAYYTSRVYFSQYKLESSKVDGYGLLNAFINFSAGSSGLYGSVFIRNIADITRVSHGYPGSPLTNSPLQVTYIPPRTFGLRVGYRF